VEYADKTQCAALMEAAQRNNADIIEPLLGSGADADQQCNGFGTALRSIDIDIDNPLLTIAMLLQ
jgi:hypothetical protein